METPSMAKFPGPPSSDIPCMSNSVSMAFPSRVLDQTREVGGRAQEAGFLGTDHEALQRFALDVSGHDDAVPGVRDQRGLDIGVRLRRQLILHHRLCFVRMATNPNRELLMRS